MVVAITHHPNHVLAIPHVSAMLVRHRTTCLMRATDYTPGWIALHFALYSRVIAKEIRADATHSHPV